LPGRLIYETKLALVPEFRVLVVNSYHEGMKWEQDIQKGIVEGLKLPTMKPFLWVRESPLPLRKLCSWLIPVPAPEVAKWTVHNNKLPELGLIATHAEDGILAAAGISYYKTGIYVGVIGGNILGDSEPATIAIVDPRAVDISFNLEMAEMLGIEIPAMELVEATEVFRAIR